MNAPLTMSYEAKARGVTRGMRIAEMRKVCPEAVILPSDYKTYSLLSERFFAIVRRFTPDVEEYSIDECFADLTGLRRPLRMSYLLTAIPGRELHRYLAKLPVHKVWGIGPQTTAFFAEACHRDGTAIRSDGGGVGQKKGKLPRAQERPAR